MPGSADSAVGAGLTFAIPSPQEGPPVSDPNASQRPPAPSPYAAAPYDSAPYGSPYGPPPGFQPKDSTAMATWALVLAFLPFVPLGFFASIGLAIAALVRSRQGHNFGRNRAIVALVVNALWVVVIAVLVGLTIAGVIDLEDAQRDENGRVTETTSIPVTSLKVGDCFDDAATRGSTDVEAVSVVDVTVKPCTELHDFELYAVFDVEDGSYPGEAALQNEANEKCFALVDEYAGLTGKVREASYYFFYPQKLQWNVGHDRTVQCMLGFDSGQTKGSLRKA